MPYVTAKLVGYGVIPPDTHAQEQKFTVVGLWTYRGKPGNCPVVGHYSTWLRASAVKKMLERTMELEATRRTE